MMKRSALLATSASLTALLALAPAHAQDADNEDVVYVTATKRQTTLQDTPVAVTVTPADVIEKAQILDIKDLQTVVPTFRVSQLQNAGNTTLTIRGFGNGGNNIGIEPSVGLFIDGVYRSRAAAQIGDLPNLERVEVLSGPQSTLFGKNASAGVVSIVTAAPSFESQGYIEGGIGNYGLNYVKGYLSGAPSDTFAVSLGGGYQKRDGYFEPAAGSDTGDFNNLDRFNIRAQALWEPTDALSARVIFDTSTLDENCCGVATAVVGPTAAAVGALGGQIPTPTDPFSYETAVNRDVDNKIDDSGISLQVDYDMDFLGGLTLTSITSQRENKYDYNSDSDFTTLALLDDVFQFVNIDTFTQELRLTSTGSGPLAWMIGGYYFDEDINQDSGLIYGEDLRDYIDILSGGALGGIEQVLGLDAGTFFDDDQRVFENFTQANEAYSVFGTLDFDVSDRLTVTLGGNYTEDKKDVTANAVFNEDIFSNVDLQGAQGAAVIGAGVFASGQAPIPGLLPDGIPSFTQFTGAILGAGNALAFTPANVGALASGQFGAEAAAAFGQYNAGVQGFAGAVAASPNSPLAGLFPLQFQPRLLEFPNSVEDGRTRDDEFTYTVKAAYEVSDNLNVYASTGTGFKASSWNLTRDTRPFLADAAALGTAGLLPNNYNAGTGRNFGTRFSGPEEVTVYEIGAKARFDWGAINVAVFDQTIDGFQSTLFQGTGFVLANAGSQSTRGVEFDSTFTPSDALTLGLSGILQDPKYDDYQNAPGPNGTVVDLSGEKPAGINEISLTASAQYEFVLSDSLDAYVRGDWQYEDEVQIVDNIEGVTRETNQFNAALGFTYDSLDVRFWGRNIFNDETFTSAFPGVVQAGTVNTYPNQPRTYGVSLRKNF